MKKTNKKSKQVARKADRDSGGPKDDTTPILKEALDFLLNVFRSYEKESLKRLKSKKSVSGAVFNMAQDIEQFLRKGAQGSYILGALYKASYAYLDLSFNTANWPSYIFTQCDTPNKTTKWFHSWYVDTVADTCLELKRVLNRSK